MLNYRLGTVNDFHWGFKPVLSYLKPHTVLSSHDFYKELEPLTYEQQDNESDDVRLVYSSVQLCLFTYVFILFSFLLIHIT